MKEDNLFLKVGDSSSDGKIHIIDEDRLLTWFGTLLQFTPCVTIDKNFQLLRFMNSSYNQQDEFVNAILSDSTTKYRNTSEDNISIIPDPNKEFSTLQSIVKIMKKVQSESDDENEDENEEVDLDDNDDTGIVKFPVEELK